ncbi:MAG TPA: hypothetical protein VFA74_16455 [Terriglobales bacterium]|nr:hypothetical protein [Terriglobales bacterium]
MDRMEEVVLQSQLSVGVLSDTEGHLKLMNIADATHELAASLAERGMCFLGVIGLSGSEVKCAFNTEFSPSELVALHQAFAGLVDRAVSDVEENLKSADWLQRLYQLPDLREN